jgi:hypothetical protein
MSNITSYPGIQLIENDDLMVISDVSEAGNPTRTVSIGTLSTVFETGGGSTNNILGIYPILVSTQGINTTISIAGGTYQDKLTLTTNGTSGPATLLGSTLNIPQYSGGDGGGNSLDTFMLTGMVKTLGDDSKYGPDPAGANYQPMEWTSASTNDDQIPLWRTPIQAKLELVTWAYMGDALVFDKDDYLDFNIGIMPQGVNSGITSFAPIDTMFSLTYEGTNNTRPQGQLDVSSKNIVLNEFQNIAVVANQRANSTISPVDGDFAICLYFRATSESGGGDPGDGEKYTVTLTDIVDNVVGEPGTYTISGNAIGDFVQGVNGTSWAFRNEVIPATGYEVDRPGATNPSGSINGQDEDVINIISGTVTETSEDRFTVTMTPLVNNIVNNDNIIYTLNGDADAATRTGVAGGLWNFTTGIDPLPSGYYIDGFTATNPSGVFSADVSVQQEVGGEIKSKDSGGTDKYTVTLSPFNDNIIVPGGGLGSPSFGSAGGSSLGGDTGDGPSYYTLGGDLAGATQTGAFGTPYAFNTTITLASGYEWRVQPSITNPSGTIPGNDVSVAQTITGEIQAITTGDDQFTVTLSPLVDAITLPSAAKGPTGPTSQYYTITGASQGDSVTGPTGTNYSFNNGITMQPGWTIENFNPNNLQGIIGTSNITRSKTITGQVVAEAQDQVTVTYKLSDFIADTDPNHYTLTGNTDQDTVTGAPGDPYSFSTGIQVDPGYSINNFTSTDPSGTIPASDISVSASVTGTIVQDTEQTFTVTSAWSDQITQSSGALSGSASSFGPTNPPYTITGDINGATVTGTTGTSYSFNNVVTANAGFTFTEGPTVSNPSGTIGNSNQTVQQVFTGVIVEDSTPPADPGQVWKFEPGTGIQGDGISGTYYDTSGNQQNFFIEGTANAGATCICIGPNLSVPGNPYEPTIYDISPDAIAYAVLENGEPLSCNNDLTFMTCPIGN